LLAVFGITYAIMFMSLICTLCIWYSS